MSEPQSLDILQELLAIPSVTGDEEAIAAYVERFCREFLPAGQVIRSGNAIIALQPSLNPAATETIVLAGHTDTVISPNNFTGKIHEGRLYGLGSSDMKAGDAVMMEIIRAYGRQWAGAYHLVHVLYDAEEGPYEENGLGPVLEEHGHLFRQALLAICPEPTDNLVQVGCLGTIHATVTFKGVRAHSARPWLGDNAIYQSTGYLNALAQLQPVDHTFGQLLYREVMHATTTTTNNTKTPFPTPSPSTSTTALPPARASSRPAVKSKSWPLPMEPPASTSPTSPPPVMSTWKIPPCKSSSPSAVSHHNPRNNFV